MIEYGRIRRETSDREFVDVAGECATRQELARDVVKPEALAEVVQLLSGSHVLSPCTHHALHEWTYGRSTFIQEFSSGLSQSEEQGRAHRLRTKDQGRKLHCDAAPTGHVTHRERPPSQP
jgi:hypothetical protein